ncbi:MAG: ATP-grasp domain-containing protein [Bacillota bacterium]|nr:ATP-grasp domain-containing protein [Bacillota bacterium]
MNDNTVYIIESNSAGNGVSAILNAKEKGYQTHFLTNMPSKYENMVPNPMKISDKVTMIDTMDTIQLLRFFEDKNPAAIMTFDDFHIIPTSIVSNAMGITAPPVKGLINVRFKDKTREKTKGIGYPTRFVGINTDSLPLSSPIGYPCVVKPIDESGSVGVKLCFDDKDFIEAAQKIEQFYSNVTGYKYIKRLLVEEYIEGEEYSAEICWDIEENKWKVIGFTKKIVSDPPYFIETGHVYPYTFDPEILSNIEEVLIKWLEAVELSKCFAHIEFKIIENQPALIEINPRPAGGYINKLVGLVSKSDLTKHYLDLALRKPLNVECNTEQLLASIKFILPPKTGELINVEESEVPRWITDYELASKSKNIRSITSGDDRLGYVISVGTSAKELLSRNQLFIDSLHFIYRNESEKCGTSKI